MRKLLTFLMLVAGILGGVLLQRGDLRLPMNFAASPSGQPEAPSESPQEPAPSPAPAASASPAAFGAPISTKPIAQPSASRTAEPLQPVMKPTDLPKELIPARFEMRNVRDSFVVWRAKENTLTVSFFDEPISPAERERVVTGGDWSDVVRVYPRLEFAIRLYPGRTELKSENVAEITVDYLWLVPGTTSYRRVRQTIARNGNAPAFEQLSGALTKGATITGKTAFSTQASVPGEDQRALSLSWDLVFSNVLLSPSPVAKAKQKFTNGLGTIELGGDTTTLRGSLIFGYPKGPSVVVALFDEPISDEDRKAFQARRTLLAGANQKSPLLVFALDLDESSGVGFSCGRIKSYTAYWTPVATGPRLVRGEQLRRVRSEFTPEEWRVCSGGTAGGELLQLSGSGRNLAAKPDQRLSWNFSIQEQVFEVR